MKELNIEEKAKAYDEAIKVIKDNLGALNEITETGANVVNIQSIRNCFYRAFPELKESEDEKIRKALIDFFSTSAELGIQTNGVYDRDIIAWLEKQYQKETTWNKEDEKNVNNILYVFNQLKGTSSYKEDNTAEKTIKWLKSLKDRLYSSNEYDKNMLGAIEYCTNNNRQLEKEHIAWLEKQGKQKPAEWSEEDEEMIDEIIDYMKPMPIFFESTKGKSGKEYTKEFIKNATKWLSRLKYRVQLQKNLIATDEEFVQAKKDAYNDALD